MRSKSALALGGAVALAMSAAAHAGITWSVTSVTPRIAVDFTSEGEPVFGGDPGFLHAVGSTALPPSGHRFYGDLDGGPAAMRLTGAELDTAMAANNNVPFFALEIEATGLVTAPFANGDNFVVDWDFSIDFSGGIARWYSFGAGFGHFDAADAFLTGYGISTGLGDTDLIPTSHGFGGTFEYDFFPGTNLGLDPSLARVVFSTILVFKWTGYEPGDTFVLNIPNESIDISVVPAPAGTAVLALAGLAAARRRRA